MTKKPEDFLPLSQATYYILLALQKCRHGYAIMQDVEKISKGNVALGPGTLYGALSKLQKQGVIEQAEADEEDRRKYYILTSLGEEIVKQEYNRLLSLVMHTQELMEEEGEIKWK
ncbi:PadR family transcriptional regulator [Domibacillus indicus]|uniref:PadR family transcriptional regulator n=1 Tax=Domibacillus indicus TaxID=1437523 RepID=UPI000617BA71|nr:PadR family transcriptional regulator [Domibacillus indicus]